MQWEACNTLEDLTCFASVLRLISRYFFQIPPDGEFPVMNYRMTQEFKPPFRINALIEEAGPLKVSKTCLPLKCNFSVHPP